MPFVFHAIRQTCLSGRHGKQKIAVCGLLRSAGLARAPAASRRERARGAKRTASKAWPITENFTRKQIQIVSLFEVPSPQDQQDKRYRKVSLIFLISIDKAIVENIGRQNICRFFCESECGVEINFTPAHSTYFHTKVLSYRKENSIFVLRKNVFL